MKSDYDITTLKSQDIYSLMLFALYKLKNIPEYSSLSELAYILDKDNLLKLCEYFGGTTITIPTIEDLEGLTEALILYQYVDIDKMDYERATELIGHKSADLRQVKSNYVKLKDVLTNFEFTERQTTL